MRSSSLGCFGQSSTSRRSPRLQNKEESLQCNPRQREMTERILFVDDQPELLATFQFTLGKKFNIITAQGGDAGLAAIRNQGPFAVVVSDLEMPGLDGLHFLEVVKASSPDSVRLMLTSKTDHQTTIEVVNQANIFRFLN